MTENSSTEAEWRTNHEIIRSENLKIEVHLHLLMKYSLRNIFL